MTGTHMRLTGSFHVIKIFWECVGFVPVAVINTLKGRVYFIIYCQVTVQREGSQDRNQKAAALLTTPHIFNWGIYS